MNEANSALQRCRNGVFEGADGCSASRLVGELGEVGIKETVRLRYSHVDGDPITSGSKGPRSEIIGRKPVVNGRDGVRSGCDV